MDKLKVLLTRKYTKSEAIGIILSIVAIGTVIDIFMGRFSIFFIAFAIFLVVAGVRSLKRKKSFTGYLFIAIGSGSLLFSLFTSFSFALIFAALIIYNAYQLFRSSSNKAQVNVNIEPNPLDAASYINIEPYFKNKIVGEYRDLKQGYAIEDINIQTGFGDVVIDLSNTIIPNGETVILIRGAIGNVYLNVPPDIGMSVQMSLLCGKMNLLQDSKTAFNLNQKYQSVDYQASARKIKIVVSLLVGDIEVKHR
ncbi:MAG: cell wall-active antibiotics response protein LiaF [Turicibacter sp.]|nr:cell wall-active antibiotics response protein LiaF [Turicibacter sp.]